MGVLQIYPNFWRKGIGKKQKVFSKCSFLLFLLEKGEFCHFLQKRGCSQEINKLSLLLMNVYAYYNYRKYLQDYYEYRKSVQRYFSYRSFAKKDL